MNAKFKAGDLVKLKEGKFLMSVAGNAVVNKSNQVKLLFDSYVCTWFDGSRFQKATFHEDAIEAFKML